MSTNAEYTIGWLGYNEKPNHNRIWGWLTMRDGRVFVFFGVKNMKIQFKKHDDIYTINYLINQMEFRGYEKIKVEHYALICPTFVEQIETWLISAILGENFT